MESILRFLNMISSAKLGFAVEIVICEILFSYSMKFRKWRWQPLTYIIIAVGLAVHFTVAYFLPLLKIPGLTTLFVFAITIIFQWIIFGCSLNRTLFNSVAAYSVQNLGVNVRSFIMALLPPFGGWGRLGVRFALTAAVYVFAYFFFARKSSRKKLSIGYAHLYIMSFLSVLIANTLFAVLLRNGMLNEYTYIILAICCLLALLYQFSIFKSANLDREIVTIEKLLYYEQKQHNLSQETIDLINVKCHDLKKQVTALKELLGDRAEEALGETEKAISVYENMVNTGNKNLDLIILEERNYCSKYGISIDVMADGAQLDFMAPADIYSLFSNALNNAIENVMYEAEDSRNVELRVYLSGEYVCISVTNKCTRPVKFVNGLPVTGKQDKKFHGYGMRSMEYIVDKYGGNMVVNVENCIFTVKIIIKKPS